METQVWGRKTEKKKPGFPFLGLLKFQTLDGEIKVIIHFTQ